MRDLDNETNVRSTLITYQVSQQMKILIQYTQAGKYKDQAWEAQTLRSKGDIQAVTPSYAAQLVKQNKANLMTNENEEIIIQI